MLKSKRYLSVLQWRFIQTEEFDKHKNRLRLVLSHQNQSL